VDLFTTTSELYPWLLLPALVLLLGYVTLRNTRYLVIP
jgi:Ca-activated chloride channel family protein